MTAEFAQELYQACLAAGVDAIAAMQTVLDEMHADYLDAVTLINAHRGGVIVGD